jgi:hypothetical protein
MKNAGESGTAGSGERTGVSRNQNNELCRRLGVIPK